MANKPVTLAGLRKDILELYALVVHLQDSHVALRNQVQRMEAREEPAFIKLLFDYSLTPSPPSPKPRMDKGGKRGKNK